MDILVVEKLNLPGHRYASAHWVTLIREFKLHFAEIIALVINIVLRSFILQALSILENSFNCLLIVLKAFLGQLDVDLEC